MFMLVFIYMYSKCRYYKTVAAQEPGEDNILSASYRKKRKDISKSAHLLPFFGTDYGLCRYAYNLSSDRKRIFFVQSK